MINSTQDPLCRERLEEEMDGWYQLCALCLRSMQLGYVVLGPRPTLHSPWLHLFWHPLTKIPPPPNSVYN